MSLFDFIENNETKAADPGTQPGKAAPQKSKKNNQAQPGPPIRPSKPERLQFLAPCPVCGGTVFIHGRDNGFFCNNCQPGITGRPVIAAGSRQHQKTVKGLPCSQCGSASYIKIINGFIFDDGTLTDGWHCGGKNCLVKLLLGNKKADQAAKKASSCRTMAPDPVAIHAPTRPVHAQQKRCFQAAYPWIKEHLPELLRAGWTRPELFRRSIKKWPVQWGIAWLSAWTRPELQVHIDSKSGAIVFLFENLHGQQVKQTGTPYAAQGKKYNRRRCNL